MIEYSETKPMIEQLNSALCLKNLNKYYFSRPGHIAIEETKLKA